MEVITQTSLSTLPVEMLDQIFSFLETRDLRSIKRVCQRLNEILNRSFYCEREIIVWKRINDIELLNASQRSVFNLYIDTVNFDDDFVLTFFRQHGSKVRSLTFRNCNFPRQLLENIIRECTALRSFSFENSEKFVSSLPFNDFFSLEAESIVSEGVTSLTFNLGRTLDSWIDEQSFNRFMSIFPNVKRLDIQINLGHDRSDSSSSENNRFTESTILHYILRIGPYLEELKINFLLKTILVEAESFFEALPNLNHLCLGWILSDFADERDIMNFRNQLQRIPSLEIRGYRDSVTDLLRAFRVKHLTMAPPKELPYSSLFLELLQSELQTVELNYIDSWTIPRSVVDSPLMRANTTLTDLYFKNDFTVNDEAVTACLKYFNALVHLRIKNASDRNLQSIFLYQKNLRSLHINNSNRFSINGFAGTRNRDELSIRELQKLEHLTLIKCKAAVVTSKRFQDAFQLPRLKYLYIEASFTRKIKFTKLPVEMFQSMSNLEAIKIVNFKEPSFEELASLCENLKKLRYLCHTNDRGPDCRTCFLDLSESTFQHFDVEDGLLHYDDSLQKTVLKNKYFDCRFFSPKISSFVIDWITY